MYVKDNLQAHKIATQEDCGSSLVAQQVKNPPAMPETRVLSLGQEDPLEKEMGSNSSILAWEIPWTEEPGRLYSSWVHTRSDTA